MKAVRALTRDLPAVWARLRLRFTLRVVRSDDCPMFGPPRLATTALTVS